MPRSAFPMFDDFLDPSDCRCMRCRPDLHTPELLRIRAASERLDEQDDCAPAALTIASGQPYEVVRDLCLKLGRRPRCGMTALAFIKAARHLGLELQECDPFTAERHKRAGRTIFMMKQNHVFACKDGKTHDPAPHDRSPVEGGLLVTNR